jgi:hypothetical protein
MSETERKCHIGSAQSIERGLTPGTHDRRMEAAVHPILVVPNDPALTRQMPSISPTKSERHTENRHRGIHYGPRFARSA